MDPILHQERGQALVEFGLIASILFILTVGLVDVGRAFLQYNMLADEARYGARFAAVAGGTCSRNNSEYNGDASQVDWCNQLGQVTASTANRFFNQTGNKPLQASTAACPTTYDPSAYSAYYYRVSDYKASTSSTVIGAIAHKLDSTSSATSITGAITPALDLSRVYACIQLTDSTYNSSTAAWDARAAEHVGVHLYYSFQPVSGILTRGTVTFGAYSAYYIE